MPDSDLPPIPTNEEVEAAAVRRRWITLAEVLGVIAVLISGLTLWNAWRERSSDEADKAAARAEAQAEAQALLLRATPDRDGRRLGLAAASAGQAIQNQNIAFPAPLGVAAVDTLIEPRIEADWFEQALLRARHEAGRDEDSRGDERLPIAIVTTFFSGGRMYRDSAIYDVGYRVEGGGLFGGHHLRLRGISRVETVSPRTLQARLDALWASRQRAARPS
jgi:predicted xylose isomerase-like sugar epimerase